MENEKEVLNNLNLVFVMFEFRSHCLSPLLAAFHTCPGMSLTLSSVRVKAFNSTLIDLIDSRLGSYSCWLTDSEYSVTLGSLSILSRHFFTLLFELSRLSIVRSSRSFAYMITISLLNPFSYRSLSSWLLKCNKISKRELHVTVQTVQGMILLTYGTL